MSIHKYMFLWLLNGCLYTNICSYVYQMDIYTKIYVLMMIKWMFIPKYMFLWSLNGCLYTNICSYDH